MKGPLAEEKERDMNRQLAEEEGSGMRGLWADDGICIVYKNIGFRKLTLKRREIV